ncbi:MAG: DUF1801 domain-containing protein [Chitinophagaceae bacterium]|nr:DUF1801 domain-containing protein [Chitinophagaceae bacterium]
MAKAISKPTTVDEYIASVDPAMQKMLRDLRKTIKLAAPKAEECISYQIPTYKNNGALVHFAAFTNHCSLVVVNLDIINQFKKELAGYKISGRTIQFTPGNPLPAGLVTKIVKMRVKQNEELASVLPNKR